MPDVFSIDHSVFFVGGRGDGSSGVVNPGGCTKTWWDNSVATFGEAATMALLMTANGAPIVAQTGCSVTGATTIQKTGQFGTVQAGMAAYVAGTGVLPGIYRITAASNDVLTFGDVGGEFTGSASDIVVNVGGAFDSMSSAIHTGTHLDASLCNIIVYDNLDESPVGAITCAVTGSAASNTWLNYQGYNVVPGDTCWGGAHFGGALAGMQDTHGWVVLAPAAVWVDKDLGGISTAGALDLSGSENVVFQNLRWRNMSAGRLFNLNARYNLSFRNCRIESINQLGNSYQYALWFDHCLFYDITSLSYPTIFGGGFTRCVFDNSAAGVSCPQPTTASLIGCLFYGGTHGLHINRNLIQDCLFYGQTYAPFRMTSGTGTMVQNCWAAPACGTSDHLWDWNSGSWSPISDFVGVFGADGEAVPDANKASLTPGVASPSVDNMSEIDPVFMAPANGDFRRAKLASLDGVPDLWGNRRRLGPEDSLQCLNPGGVSIGAPIAGAF